MAEQRKGRQTPTQSVVLPYLERLAKNGASFNKNNIIWEATLNIANSTNGEKILYDINPIKKVGQSVKSDTSPTKRSISNYAENATKNPKKSLSENAIVSEPTGTWNVRGEDIALEELGPVAEGIPVFRI